MPILVCLGDSITAKEYEQSGTLRLTSRLRTSFSSWTVINSGVPSSNTRMVLSRLQTDVLAHYPDLVTVLLGTNDASEHKRVDILEYEENLTSIVLQISAQKTILITPPPISQERLFARKQTLPLSNFVTMEALSHYAQIVKKVSVATGSHLINLWELMNNQAHYSKFLKEDGVHFSEQGYEFLAKVVTNKIQSIWEARDNL